MREDFQTDNTACAGTVINNNLLAKTLSQFLPDDACGDICATAGGYRDDHADWF